MIRPRVFVVNEPMKYDARSGEMIPVHNIRPATEFGDLTFVLHGSNRPSEDPDVVLPQIREAMRNFNQEDYILLVGDMDLVAWAVALAYKSTGTTVKLLKWSREGRYMSRTGP
jgi:hypothetical protein